jgi:transposase
MILSQGTTAEGTQAQTLIEGFKAQSLLADKAYDHNAFLKYCQEHNITSIMPPKKNRKILRPYDEYLYKLRHLVENAFLKLKRWRGIATQHAQTSSSFIAACFLAATILWITYIKRRYLK